MKNKTARPDSQAEFQKLIHNSRFRNDCETLTDSSGAILRRRFLWPEPMSCVIGEAHPETISICRSILAGGDEAHIVGPIEIIVVMSGTRYLSLTGWRD